MTQNCPVAGSCSAVDRSIVISAKTTLTWNSWCSPWYTGWILGECGQMTTLTLKLGILSEDMWRHISTLLHPIFHPRRVSATYAGCKKDELGRHYGELESVFDTSVLPECRSPTELLPAWAEEEGAAVGRMVEAQRETMEGLCDMAYCDTTLFNG